MPPITSQTVNPDGFTIVTDEFGTLQMITRPQGNSYHMEFILNGSRLSQTNVSQPTPQKVEDQGRQWASQFPVNFFWDWHVFSLSPFNCIFISSYQPITDPDWWR